jgi:hypothetical protein
MVTIIIDKYYIIAIINHGYYNLISTISSSTNTIIDGMVTTLYKPLLYNLSRILLRGKILILFYLKPKK